MLEVRIAVEQLRRLADEIENGKRVTVYHEPTSENLCTVFGVDTPTTLDEQMIP